MHSPFMYDICRNVLISKEIPQGAKRALDLGKQLIVDGRQIDRLDMGAGSQGGTKLDTVSRLARKSSGTRAQLLFLARMASYFKPKSILELGTCLGLGAISMAGSSPGSRVHTIEGCPQTADIARENIKKAGIDGITQHVGAFDDLLPGLLSELGPVDMAYIDGNHRGNATIAYFEMLLPCSTDQTILIFDDIRWSRDMLLAWKHIKAHPRVRVSMDLFTMGVAFFRSGLSRQHYYFMPRP